MYQCLHLAGFRLGRMHPLGVNVGALVPFNPLRLYVMGIDDSRQRVQGNGK